MQDTISYDAWDDSKFEMALNSEVLRIFEICKHDSLLSKASEIDAVYNGTKPSFSYTCPICNTDSLIEFRIICSRPALILTRWANLGTGIDRDDPLWKIHVFTCKDEKMPSILPKELRLHRPRKSYENTASLSLKELSSRNLSYLQGDQYKNWLSPLVRSTVNQIDKITCRDCNRRMDTRGLLVSLYASLYSAYWACYFRNVPRHIKKTFLRNAGSERFEL